MRFSGNADSIEIVGDEDGWHMIVETDDGDRFNFRIHGIAEDISAEVDLSIGKWLDEKYRAGLSRPSRRDLDGYDLNDPKRVALEREIH